MYAQFVHLALGNEDGGVQLVYEGICCLAWGVIFDRSIDRGVVIQGLRLLYLVSLLVRCFRLRILFFGCPTNGIFSSQKFILVR